MDINEELIVDSKKHYEKLVQIAERIKQRGYWSEFQSIHENVEQHITSFFIEILGKDAVIENEEVFLINSLLGKNYSKGRLVSEHARVGRAFIQVPVYLTSCIKMDLFDKSSYSYELLNCIKSLGLSLMAADNNVSEAECKFLNAYIACITELVDRFGIKESKADLNSCSSENREEDSSVVTSRSISCSCNGNESDVSSLLKELDELTGLEKVKSEVKALVDLIKVRKLRSERGLPIVPMSFHLVFTGKPGTGKTTVARLISKIYHRLGLLPTDKVVEVDRAGLIAGYVGQTAAKVQEVINRALGGVLFIDEAYSLISENSENDFGNEAISALLKGMEDNRDKLIVIAAGYENEMARFIDSNPGLKSRFSKKIHFDDYTPQQMLKILKIMCKNSGYEISPSAEEEAIEYFYKVQREDASGFGNARGVRNFFEQAVSRQASRIVNLEDPDDLELVMLKDCDFISECNQVL